jgi:hypothetical protein
VNFLKLFGLACSGWLLARSALAAIQLLGEGRGDPEFLRAKIICAKFHADHLLPQTQALAHAITQGADAVMGLEVEAL